MRCKVCGQEMIRSVSFQQDGPGCELNFKCPSQCDIVTQPLSTEPFNPELFNLQLASLIAEYTGKSARDVMRIFVSTARPDADGEMTISLEDVEQPLGLAKGFFSEAIAR